MSVIPLPTEAITFQPLTASFHPQLSFTINTTIPSSLTPPETSGCELHLALTLPDALFIDKDEISDAQSLQWRLSPDTIDIERPVQDIPLPSLLVFNLALGENGIQNVNIPLHARYLAPNDGGYDNLGLFGGGKDGQVNGGWVCHGVQSRDLPLIPVQPLSITLATGRPSHQPLVELGTTFAVWSCFIYLAYKILYLSSRPRSHVSKLKAS